MIVFALDLGVRTGWALSRDGTTVTESGEQIFDLRRGESAGMRYLRFRRWLEDVIGPDATNPDREWLVVYEQAHHRGGYTTEVHNGLATRIQEHCAKLGYEYHAVHSATLKKWTTGSGRAKKEDMRRAALRRGWVNTGTTADENEIDAVALLHYALGTLVPARS